MYGAILGDIIGSPYEFDRGGKTKDFPLFSKYSMFTDDSVMTVAVAEALMDAGIGDPEETKAALVKSMRHWGQTDPDAGYGGMFYRWLHSEDPQPYNSYGNGSAMRASSAGWLFESFEDTWKAARLTAEVTHNHPEGIKGAMCVAVVIWMARNGKSKQEIRETVGEVFESFEDVIRTADSLGGDCDTLTCIAGSMAEAFYGVPEALKEECRKRITPAMREVLARFDSVRIGG